MGLTVTSEEDAIAIIKDYYAQDWGKEIEVKLMGCYYVKEGK